MPAARLLNAFDRYFPIYQEEEWGFYEALHAVCERLPSHGSLSNALGKVAIIGEMYRTRALAHLPRPVNNDKWRVLASHFVKKSAELDPVLNEFAAIGEPESPDDYVTMARGVAEIERIAQDVALRRNDGAPRSMLVFSSKYAQAHARGVVVIDKVAETALKSLFKLWPEDPWVGPIGEALSDLRYVEDQSKRYIEHLARFAAAHNFICRHRGEITTKITDFVLYKHGAFA